MRHLPEGFLSHKQRMRSNASCRDVIAGFSLVEILVALAVLTMMSVMIISVTSSAQRVVKVTAARVEQFRESRRAFERINQHLSLATLNTYWDYVNSSGQPRTAANATTFTPSRYARISELRYLQTGTNATSVPLTAPRGGALVGQAVFFQAPLGKTNNSAISGMKALVNTVGYFIEKGGDNTLRPLIISGPYKNRHRLFELIEPAENLTIYSLTSGSATYNGNEWFATPLAVTAHSHRLADNIVALLFQAEYTAANLTGTQAYCYSSAPRNAASQLIEENNLPPTVRVIMIAVDEASGRRIEGENISLTDAQDDSGVDALEKQLRDKQLNYRKFESTVSVGAAKWSTK